MKTPQSNQMYFTHILFHKHQQIGRAKAPSPSAAKLIKCLRTKVREVEFTWESRVFVCLTKAEGEKEAQVEKGRGEHAGERGEMKEKWRHSTGRINWKSGKTKASKCRDDFGKMTKEKLEVEW